jgi:hypothetical protein
LPLAVAAPLLLDTALCGEQVTQQMQTLAAQEGSSLRLLSPAALVELFLPRLLPHQWHSQLLVEWEQSTAGVTTAGDSTGAELVPDTTPAVASEQSALSWWVAPDSAVWASCCMHVVHLARAVTDRP